MRLLASGHALDRLLLLLLRLHRLAVEPDSVRHGAQLFRLRDNTLAIGRDAGVNHIVGRYARAASTVREICG